MRIGHCLVIGMMTFASLVRTAAPARADAPSSPPPVRMTVEVDWNRPSLPDLPAQAAAPVPIGVEVPGGRVLGAVSWPPGAGAAPAAQPGGDWRLGGGPSGRARVRVEAPLGGNLVVRTGSTLTAFPVAGLLEAPQQTAAGAPVAVNVKRLPWDALEVDLTAPNADGTVAPGSAVPIRVGFNVLTAEPSEGLLRLVGTLTPAAGGEPVWRCDQSQFVGSDRPPGSTPAVLLTVTVPDVEGAYRLELQSFWEPVVEESSRLSRLIRRRRPSAPAPVATTRRLTLTAIRPGAPASAAPSPSASAPATTIVDQIDLTGRVRGSRPSASGRAAATPGPGAPWAVPEAALVQAAFRDRLRGWILRGDELATLGPPDAAGLAWAAVALRVPNPGHPHRLHLTVTGGDPAALAVAMIHPAAAEGEAPRVLLDAVGWGAAVAPGTAPSRCTWPVWPDAAEPVLVVVNRGAGTVTLGAVALEEQPAGPSPARPAGGPAPAGFAPRSFGLTLTGPGDLDRFGGAADALTLGRNLAAYLLHCGAGVAVLPEALADRDARRALDGQADEDAIGADRLGLVLKAMADRSLAALVELRADGPLPGLPAPDDPEALRRGLVRLDGAGRPDAAGPVYHALHPDVRGALGRRAAAALAARAAHPNLRGLLLRLGPGPTLPGAADTGLDDDTFARFIAAMLDAEATRRVPGLGTEAPERFAARRQYVTGPGAAPWQAWRSREVAAGYEALAAAVRGAAPDAVLAIVTPGLDGSPAGVAARRADAAGESPLSAWKELGLDLEGWPEATPGLVVLRGVDPRPEPLARDLATHPDLDLPVARLAGRGVLVDGPAAPPGDDDGVHLAACGGGEEPLGHALAVLDARWMLLAATAAAGREEALARFARVYLALPADAPASRPLDPEAGVAARTWTAGDATVLGLANDTPYTIRVDATLRVPAGAAVDDVGRGLRLDPRPAPGGGGGRSLVLDLLPFGAAAVRVGGPGAKADPVALYPPRAVEEQYQSLAARLDRLVRGGGLAGLRDGGFEGDAPNRPIPVAAIGTSSADAAADAGDGGLAGWEATGGAANSLALDAQSPHGGKSSLRLDVPAAPGAAQGAPFTPPGGPALDLRVWLRAEPAGSRVRIWLDGRADGQPHARRAEVVAGPNWAEHRVVVRELPEAGLDRLALRFELPAAGRLWVDDLALSGSRPSAPDLRAQRVLVRAQQAKREGRLADFARLANSHWAREAGVVGIGPPAEAPAATARTGRASDLPQGRRLR
jgi:hypothetical protein